MRHGVCTYKPDATHRSVRHDIYLDREMIWKLREAKLWPLPTAVYLRDLLKVFEKPEEAHGNRVRQKSDAASA